MENEFPRKSDLQRMKPAELAIHQAIQEIEKLGANEKLTNAVIKLNEAKELVADFIDKK